MRTTTIGLLWAALAPGLARADELTLDAVADNTLIASPEDYSNGAGAAVVVGVTNSVGIRRGLLRFDVAGSLPPGATVTAVSLELELVQAAGSLVSAELGLHAATTPWGEGTSNGPGGSGAAAEVGDATWLCAEYDGVSGCTVPWTAPGGDFEPGIDGSTTVTPVFGPYTVASTPELVARVQGWLDAPSSNLGWVFVSDDEVTQQTVAHFASREVGATGPRLVVEYTVGAATGTGTGATGTGTGATGTGTGATGTGTGTGTGGVDTAAVGPDKGCGCDASGGAAAGWILLPLALGLRRRRW